jgi:hypothetical protein
LSSRNSMPHLRKPILFCGPGLWVGFAKISLAELSVFIVNR